MRAAMVVCGAPAFAFSPLNTLPKLALDKWGLVFDDKNKALVLYDDNVDRVIPCGDVGGYYQAIISRLEQKRTVGLVPETIAMHLKKSRMVVTKQHDEYVMRTADVQSLPGGRNAALRGNVNKARRLCTVEAYDPAKIDEYKALVKVWYKQNAEIKFRTYDKTSIDWLLENWTDLSDALPDLKCLGVRHEVQLISLNLGCRLTDQHWTAYTQRFDRDAPVKAGNMLGYTELAKVFGEVELENDGTADTKTIREWKDRLVAEKISFYTVKA